MTIGAGLAEQISDLSARLGSRVKLDIGEVLDRTTGRQLALPGTISCNQSCRLMRASDGWVAMNLPRTSDWELVPAWLDDPQGEWPDAMNSEDQRWRDLERLVRTRTRDLLVQRAQLLGLAVTAVNETRSGSIWPEMSALGPKAVLRGKCLRVLDLSSLWAGPLCGAILAGMGAEVTKVESVSRPDPSRQWSAQFDERLNGLKKRIACPFRLESGTELHELFETADVVISSARPRAFEQLGLTPASLLIRKPGIIWIAITGHGWCGPGRDRVGYGDDCAAAGGLLRWTAGGEPRFLGDAVADPFTGMAAALQALRAIDQGGGVLIDAALSRVAAGLASSARATGNVQAIRKSVRA